MSYCPQCKRRFKDDPIPLVSYAIVRGKEKLMCPLCYAAEHKLIHGVEWNPSEGSQAELMYILAQEQMNEPPK